MRIASFDFLRILLTLLVVNVHIRIITGISPNFLEPFAWYTVPLFVVLSFFLTGDTKLGVRMKRLFLPFIFWSIVGFAAHPDLSNVKNMFLQLFTGQVVNTPLYYLVLLILFTGIYWLIQLIPRYKKIIYFVIFFIAFYLEYTGTNYTFFHPMIQVIAKTYGRFIELIPYVPVGLTFAFVNTKVRKKTFFILSLLFLLLSVECSFIPKPPDFHFSGFNIFFGVLAIFSFALWCSDFKLPEIVSRSVSSLGRYSFGVYLTHYILLELALKTFPNLKTFISSQQIVFLFLYTAFVYVFCYGFNKFTKRKFSFLVK